VTLNGEVAACQSSNAGEEFHVGHTPPPAVAVSTTRAGAAKVAPGDGLVRLTVGATATPGVERV